jgi:hypothetical protein
MSLCYVLTVGCIALGLTWLSHWLYEWQERRAECREMEKRIKALRWRVR